MTVGAVAFVVFFVFALVVVIHQGRPGGRGPQVRGWMPRSLRPKVNARYERKGWQAPFDEDGNRIHSKII